MTFKSSEYCVAVSLFQKVAVRNTELRAFVATSFGVWPGSSILSQEGANLNIRMHPKCGTKAAALVSDISNMSHKSGSSAMGLQRSVAIVRPGTMHRNHHVW
jgi:hypothetical protein